MAISVISVSSYSSEESVGTSAGRVILFGTVPTTIPDTTPTVTPPTTHVDTTLTPTETPTVSPIVSPSPDYIPASPDYSPIFDTESDPSEDPSLDRIPLLPAISSFLSSTDDPLDSDTLDTPPSPTHGAPFTEITLSTQRSPATSGALCLRVMILAPEQPIPHGRPYRYHPNRPVHMMTTRKRVGPLPTYCLALRHSIDYSSSDLFTSDDSSRDSVFLDSSSIGISDFHSHVTSSADLLPPPKRIRSSDSVMDLEMLLELGVDVRVVVKTVAREEVETSTRGTVEVREDRVTHPMVSDDIPKLAQEEGAIEVTYETLGSLVQRFHDHTMEIPVHRVQVIEGIQRDQGHRIVATSQQGVVISKRISGWSGIIRDLRHLVLLFKELALTSSTEALEARDAARNLEPLVEGGNEQEDENSDDYEGGNRGGNGNENGNGGGNKNRNGGGNGDGNRNGNGNGNGGGNCYGIHNVNFVGPMPVA
ncbi:hypothetical protein Tco_0855086 [Tanacetum coccineum]